MFNQFLKNQKKETQQKQNELIKRIESIVEDIIELLKNKGANYYETMDILSIVQGKFNNSLAGVLRDNAKEIREKSEELANKEKEIADYLYKINLLENAGKSTENTTKENT